jgi:hypothetical protein
MRHRRRRRYRRRAVSRGREFLAQAAPSSPYSAAITGAEFSKV